MEEPRKRPRGKRMNVTSALTILLLLILLYILGTCTAVNVVSHRVGANNMVVGWRLQTLQKALAQYHDAERSYPDDWRADLFRHPNISVDSRSFLPFDLDIQSAPHVVGGYVYHYAPTPAGCLEPACTGYRLTAVPKVVCGEGGFWNYLNSTGCYSFYLDETGDIRYCRGGTGASEKGPTFLDKERWRYEPPSCE